MTPNLESQPQSPLLPAEIEARFKRLEAWLNGQLDRIHAETLAKFRTLARSTGQRTRVDRL